MSFPQFGYAYPTAAATSLASSQILMSSASHTPTSCCETGRPIMTDPHTGQTVCSCQYTSALLNYPARVPGLPDSVYSSSYAAAAAAQSYGLGADASAFYLNSAYDLKDNADAWRPACYPYDPASMAAYPYGAGYGAMDLNGSRRKNATRETTSTLKAWLYEHRKNPYPTKGEKIMLAIITKMTLTQVSTWFANARRRLKKDNKMTWSPRNRTGDEDADDLDSDGEGENKTDTGDDKERDEEINVQDDDSLSDIDCEIEKDDRRSPDNSSDLKRERSTHSPLCLTAGRRASPVDVSLRIPTASLPGGATTLNGEGHTDAVKHPKPLHPTPAAPGLPGITNSVHNFLEGIRPAHTSSAAKPHHHHQHQSSDTTNTVSSTGVRTSAVASTASALTTTASGTTGQANNNATTNATNKPRIWSLAHTATSNSPPPSRRSPPHHPSHEGGAGGPIRAHSFIAASPMDSLRKWIDSTNGRSLPHGASFTHPYLLTSGTKAGPLSAVSAASSLDSLQTGPRSAFVSPSQSKLLTSAGQVSPF